MKINFDFKNPENRQKIMVGILVIAILATISFLYSYYFSKLFIPSVVIPSGTILTETSRPLIQVGGFDVGILKDPIFTDLKKFGEYPLSVKEDDRGRQNPFAPY